MTVKSKLQKLALMVALLNSALLFLNNCTRERKPADIKCPANKTKVDGVCKSKTGSDDATANSGGVDDSYTGNNNTDYSQYDDNNDDDNGDPSPTPDTLEPSDVTPDSSGSDNTDPPGSPTDDSPADSGTTPDPTEEEPDDDEPEPSGNNNIPSPTLGNPSVRNPVRTPIATPPIINPDTLHPVVGDIELAIDRLVKGDKTSPLIPVVRFKEPSMVSKIEFHYLPTTLEFHPKNSTTPQADIQPVPNPESEIPDVVRQTLTADTQVSANLGPPKIVSIHLRVTYQHEKLGSCVIEKANLSAQHRLGLRQPLILKPKCKK